LSSLSRIFCKDDSCMHVSVSKQPVAFLVEFHSARPKLTTVTPCRGKVKAAETEREFALAMGTGGKSVRPHHRVALNNGPHVYVPHQCLQPSIFRTSSHIRLPETRHCPRIFMAWGFALDCMVKHIGPSRIHTKKKKAAPNQSKNKQQPGTCQKCFTIMPSDLKQMHKCTYIVLWGRLWLGIVECEIS
jgi:hypothetical protein